MVADEQGRADLAGRAVRDDAHTQQTAHGAAPKPLYAPVHAARDQGRQRIERQQGQVQRQDEEGAGIKADETHGNPESEKAQFTMQIPDQADRVE